MFHSRKEAIFTVGVVERRASDFLKLWTLLERTYPSQVIPPLPENQNDPINMELVINYAVKLISEHPILREDEYFKAFMEMEGYEEMVPMIRNIEPPITIKSEYLKQSWKSRLDLDSKKMTNDLQYQKIIKGSLKLFALSDKLRQLVPLIDRLNYEFGEVKKASAASSNSIRHLLFLNKSMRVHAHDGEKVSGLLENVAADATENEEIITFLNFAIRYIKRCEALIGKLDRFRKYVGERREKLAQLAIKLDKIQMPLDGKPSFDLIYQTKLRHERELEEMAVIEVTYEKYSELVEKELDAIQEFLRQAIKVRLQTY